MRSPTPGLASQAGRRPPGFSLPRTFWWELYRRFVVLVAWRPPADLKPTFKHAGWAGEPQPTLALDRRFRGVQLAAETCAGVGLWLTVDRIPRTTGPMAHVHLLEESAVQQAGVRQASAGLISSITLEKGPGPGLGRGGQLPGLGSHHLHR